MEMAGSPAQSDPELADHFEDWVSDVDLDVGRCQLWCVGSGLWTGVGLDTATCRTSVPSLDA
ncbi:hypothetical protein Taro_029916 [Colocasia esculenta]|uniref:Uncharacterized protein n=1 Tax=Colocasia esculenta TaxID=4460 RepID=A0A843VF08_COLES|nr:hypothetical protein [Colocasia esculenta]